MLFCLKLSLGKGIWSSETNFFPFIMLT